MTGVRNFWEIFGIWAIAACASPVAPPPLDCPEGEALSLTMYGVEGSPWSRGFLLRHPGTCAYRVTFAFRSLFTISGPDSVYLDREQKLETDSTATDSLDSGPFGFGGIHFDPAVGPAVHVTWEALTPLARLPVAQADTSWTFPTPPDGTHVAP